MPLILPQNGVVWLVSQVAISLAHNRYRASAPELRGPCATGLTSPAPIPERWGVGGPGGGGSSPWPRRVWGERRVPPPTCVRGGRRDVCCAVGLARGAGRASVAARRYEGAGRCVLHAQARPKGQGGVTAVTFNRCERHAPPARGHLRCCIRWYRRARSRGERRESREGIRATEGGAGGSRWRHARDDGR